MFIHVLQETTAPPRNDAEMETQHSITNNINRESSIYPSNITKENLSGPDIISMKNFTDASGLTRENFSGPNNISLPNSTDPNGLAMENSTDLNSTAMPNSTYPNSITMDNFIDLNNITLSNSTVPKINMENSSHATYITTEHSTDPNDITTDHSTDPKDSTTGNSSDPNDITMRNSTNSNDITMNNSVTLNDTTMENSIDSNDDVKENAIETMTSTCIRQYGFPPSNLTNDKELLKRKFTGYLQCLIHEWQKLFFSELHNSTQRWNQSHDSINVDTLEHAKAAVAVWLYGSPILLAVGTIGNILSFDVMLRKKIRQSTTSFYLSVLAVADTAVLYTALLRWYIIKMNDYDIRLSSRFACKFHIFSVYAIQQFDSWVIVNVALERVCAVFLPHKIKGIFTKKFATVCLIIQALVIIGINSHFFYTRDLVVNTGRDGKLHSACLPQLPAHRSFMRNIWPWIDFCLLSLIPFTIIISSNVAIVCRLLWSRYTRRRNLHVSSSIKMTSMTAILITVSIMFLVTTAPFHIYLIQRWDLRQEANEYQKATLNLVEAILSMICYINYSINFLLYCVSGTRFREEVKAMCCCSINPIQT